MEVDDPERREMKTGLISSCGGHLTELRALQSVYSKDRHFFVLNDRIILPEDMEGKTYFIRHGERDFNVLVNFWEAWKILKEEKPDILISTGAGHIVPFALIGKIVGVPVIYIETMARVIRPSLTGRIMYYLADRFFYQWKGLEKFFPKGIYGGRLL